MKKIVHYIREAVVFVIAFFAVIAMFCCGIFEDEDEELGHYH